MHLAPPRISASALALAWFLTPYPAGAERVPVSAELERLAAEHGFSVRGTEHTEGAEGRSDREELLPRLRRLLEDFDHVIVQRGDGGVERVIILGEKSLVAPVPAVPASPGEASAAAEGDIVLTSIRRGTQHAVRASLEGAEGDKVDQVLVVDTGADFVVLPLSLAERVGLETEELPTREMQTANGTVSARMGSLPALWLGETRLEGIEAAFIEDDKLAGNGLLGMSVLGRYRLTIDDEHSQITLSARE